MVIKHANLEQLTEEDAVGQTSRDESDIRKAIASMRTSKDQIYSEESFHEPSKMQANHKTFGSPPVEDLKDFKNRIDSSDQDENASYEELNEEDLKTHSSKDEDYSEPDDDH
jgi:hypothetical protein